jgi:UDP-N-acetyl-2-amino-2-deoxyglucuronate dehydrogenase
MKAPIKFAVVGLGNIGQRHVQHIVQNKNAQLIAVCDTNTEFEKNYTVPFYNNITALLKHTTLDVINICTPNYLHAAHTIESLNASANVVCEKPMATTIADCNAMITAAELNNKTIFVVKQNRYNEPVQQVKKLISENVLGKIFVVNINCFWNRNEFYYNQSNWRGDKIKDGGCLYTQFSHFVDIMYYLFGNATAVKSVMQNFDHAYTQIEDSGVCILMADNGAIINFNFSNCSYEKNMEGAITILAEHGTVKIGGQYLNTIEYQNIKNVQLPEINIVAKNNNYGQYQGSMSNHDLMIDNVINTLYGTDTIMTNAQQGKAVVQIITDMYAACYK